MSNFCYAKHESQWDYNNKKYLTISLELSGFNLLNIYSGKEGSKHNIEPMGPVRG